jgi:iron complex transport system substrate-binding protein
MQMILNKLKVWGLAALITDLAGRQVTVPAKVERILLGEGRMLPALGALDKDPVRLLAGMMGEFEKLDEGGYAQWRARFPQLDKVPRVGRTNVGSFSDEQAVALKPQVAIFSVDAGHGPGARDRETLTRLEAAGVAVVFVDFRQQPLKNTPRSMEVLGDLLGKRKEADAFNGYWRAQLDLVTQRLAKANPPAPTVFLENRVGLSEGCCDTMVGLVGVLLDAAGAKNVARGLIPGEHGTLNPELLIAQQPQVYIGTGIGSMATAGTPSMRIVLGAGATAEAARASLAHAVTRRGIAQLQAVQEGRAHAIWHHYYNSPFNVVAVQVFAKWLHPELFKDLDPRATLQTMYTRFQPVPLDGVYWTSLK